MHKKKLADLAHSKGTVEFYIDEIVNRSSNNEAPKTILFSNIYFIQDLIQKKENVTKYLVGVFTREAGK